MAELHDAQVPTGLRRWFVAHFVIDMLFAFPLLLIPGTLMPLFGWQQVDPVTARLTGAALLGVGGASLLSRNAGVEVYRALLNMKILWGCGSVLGISLGLLQGAPVAAWLFLAIFALFSAVWIIYRWKLR